MPNKSELADKLSYSIFKNLTPNEMKQILQVSEVKLFKKGSVLVNEGDVNLLVFCILSGSVSIVRRDPELKKIVHLANLGPGQLFGEISIVIGKPKYASAVSIDNHTEVLVIDFAKISIAAVGRTMHDKLIANLIEEMARKIIYASPAKIAPEKTIFDESNTEIPNSILLLFGWKWRDIINEIPFLSGHGYDAIKIFPPQEFAVLLGRPWYELYQPVTYKLSSFYGTEEDFITMIDLCHTFGIKVYVDLVLNHMAEYPLGEKEHIGTNGTKFSKYQYGPLNTDGDRYEYEDFYHIGSEDNQVIEMDDYSTFYNSWRVEHFDLNYLPKLNFDNPHVIAVMRKYINYLLFLGVDGFRIDAAKHISTDALAKILQGLKTKKGLNPFIYLELYAGFPMGIDPYSYMEKYFNLGYVTSFSYGEFLSDAVNDRNNDLEKLIQYSFGSSWTHLPENRSVVVLDNHDTERMMPHHLNYKNSTNNAYVLAYIFMLTWPTGIPKIMSSFYFTNFQDPIPQTPVWQNGRNTGFDPDSPWVCQHRWRAISNLVLFRKKTQHAQGISHVWTNKDQVAFARTYQKSKEYLATVGFVVINNTAEKLRHRFETGLPDGEYFDLVSSDLIEGKIHGPIIKVTDYGFAEITVEPYDAVVIGVDFME